MSAVSIATRGIISPSGGGTGGPFVQPPTMLSTTHLTPDITDSTVLRPDIVSAVDDEPTENVPDMHSAQELVPESTEAINLRPRMISAEEED